jgi:transcription-repair coupling factor (superfamily II helicase)
MIYDHMDTLFDYLPNNTVIIAENPAELAQAADKSAQLAQVNYDKACSKSTCVWSRQDLFLTWEEISADLTRQEAVSLAPLVVTGTGDRLTVSADITDNSDLALAMDQARKTDQPAAPLLRWIASNRMRVAP